MSQAKRLHTVPITCVEISIDGTIAVTGEYTSLSFKVKRQIFENSD